MGHFEAAQIGGSRQHILELGYGQTRADACAFVLKPENGVNSEQLQNPFYDDVMDCGSERLQTLMRKMRESFVGASLAPLQCDEDGKRLPGLSKHAHPHRSRVT